VTLAKRAVDLDVSGTALYLNTLGVSLYRAGRYDEAVPFLERSLASGRGETDAFDLLFLAMARQRLGQTARARSDLDRALRWMREHPRLPSQWAKELREFRVEAEAVLAGPSGDLPADAFAPPPRRAKAVNDHDVVAVNAGQFSVVPQNLPRPPTYTGR
jgi:tetratricopeptide (TPR) repeat protein